MGRPRTFDELDVVRRAMDVFWDRGYERTNMHDVVEATGVGRGSLYAAFGGGKDELFLRALDLYVTEIIQPVAAQLAPGPADPAVDDELVLPRMRRVLRGVVRAAADRPGRGCLLVRTATECLPAEPTITARARLAFTELERAYATALRRAADTGELRDGVHPDAAAALLLIAVNGLQVAAHIEQHPERLDAAVDLLVDSLGRT